MATPEAFFKIVVREVGDRFHVLTFIYAQKRIAYNRRGGYEHTPYLSSVHVIEALTGLDFFPNVSDEVEAEIERVIQIRLWD